MSPLVHIEAWRWAASAHSATANRTEACEALERAEAEARQWGHKKWEQPARGDSDRGHQGGRRARRADVEALFALFGRACSPKHRGASENIGGVSEKRMLAKGRPEQAVSADLGELGSRRAGKFYSRLVLGGIIDDHCN